VHVGRIHEGQAHKYPLWIALLALIADALCFAGPYLTAPPDGQIALATYVLCWGAGLMTAIAVIYLVRYKVTIERDFVLIRTFGTREVPYDDITNVSVVPPGGAPPFGVKVVALLTDGEEINFYGALKGFDDLVDALLVKSAKGARVARSSA
jgi:hypothetical protein